MLLYCNLAISAVLQQILIGKYLNTFQILPSYSVVSKTRFLCVFCFVTIHPTTKVPEGTSRNMPARNTLVQLLAPNTDPESHNAQRHRQTDRRTDDKMMPIILLIITLILLAGK